MNNRKIPALREATVCFALGLTAGIVSNLRQGNDRLDKLERRMERLEQDQLRIRTWVSALHQLVWPGGGEDDGR